MPELMTKFPKAAMRRCELATRRSDGAFDAYETPETPVD